MNSLNIEKTKEILFLYPTSSFHIRELARRTKLNPNTIINVTNILLKKGIIKRQKTKHLVDISLNLDSKSALFEKRLTNIKRLYSSGLIDFIVNMYRPQFISVIGSYSRGEDIEGSDIDLVIYSDKHTLINVSKFEKFFNRSIHLLLPEKGKISNEFFNNLINGVVLEGTIRDIR